MGKGRKPLFFFLAWLIALPLWAAPLATVSDQRLSSTRLVLELDRPLKTSEYNHFFLKLKGDDAFRRVIDVKARYAPGVFESSGVTVPSIKIAQFSPDTTRVVLTHAKAFNISVKCWDKRLVIDIDAEGEPQKTVAKEDESEPEPIVKETPKRFGGYKPIVVVDPGHGGRDAGAIARRKTLEKDIVLKVAKETARALKERGFEVIMTRERDVYVTLQDRTGLANRVKADIFVSIHANASPIGGNLEGIETYFLSPARSDRAKDVAALENSVVVENMGRYSQETFLNFLNRETVVASNKLAIDVQRGMLFGVRERFPSVPDNGVREGPFWVLVGAQMPAVLVEVGYLTHAEEIKRLTNDTYQKSVAQGIALGVESYFVNLYR